jgi:hypothetical protein
MLSKATKDLESGLLQLSNISYQTIDSLMRKIMKKYDLTAKELHYAFKDSHNNKTPDNWIRTQMKKNNKENKEINSKVEEGISFEITSNHSNAKKQSKIRNLTKSSNENESNIAKSKLKRPESLPTFKKEEISLVEKILGEEKCGKGMYWCNTDKECKPVPSGFSVPGQTKVPTEVGIGKNVDGSKSKKSCSHTGKGKPCKVHGMESCPMSEEKDPKGPVQSYKSVEEIAKKHKVSLESIKKQLQMGIEVEKEHTSDKSDAKITALQHLDEVPDYYTKLKKVESKKNVSEATRIKAQTGNIIAITISWRGKYYYVQMFFPQLKLPSRADISFEVQKIYPDSRVISYRISELKPGEPFIQISNTNSKNYLLKNNTIGEEVEIEESKKSEMPCNEPKSQAHGSGEQGKSHVVKACENGKEKLIRFGQLGVKGSPKKKGESEEYKNRRKRFESRHAKNIAKGKMSAAYWAKNVKW